MGKIGAKTRERFIGLLRKARAEAPDFKWLDIALSEIGYARVAQQDKDIVLVTGPQLARKLGVGWRTMARWRKEDLPVYRHASGPYPMLFDVFEVFKWREARVKAECLGDPLLEGAGTSRWLEEYRKEKAREAKRRNDFEEGNVLNAADVAVQLAEAGKAFRVEAETLEKSYGPEIGQAIRGMVDRVKEAWRKIVERQAEDIKGMNIAADN